jgi:YesN/AraC family two-component response regulator
MIKVLQLKELASSMSILYVEDETKIREDMEELLKKFFAFVDCAKNGQEGLELYSQNRYDIVMTDIMMPVMEGYEMIEQIRQKSPEQVIVIMSAYDYKDFLKPKFTEGANFFLPKPSGHDAITETLLEACKLAKREDNDASLAITLDNRVAALEERVAALEALIVQKG